VLEGLRVLDLADASGYLCGRTLADLGADVVKVERPGGDPGRSEPPFARDVAGLDRSLAWLAGNTNKRGMTCDLTTSAGRDLFLRLCAVADVVIESVAPCGGSLDYPTLRKSNRGLVYTTITPFGWDGPLAAVPAGDLEVTASSGSLWLAGEPGATPVRSTLPQSASWAGMYAAMGTLMAVLARDASPEGEGQHVDVSAQASMVTAISHAPIFWDLLGEEQHRSGSFLDGRSVTGAKFRNIWPCRDGYVTFALYGGPAGRHTSRELVAWIDEATQPAGAPTALKAVDWAAFDPTRATQAEVDALEADIAPFIRGLTKEDFFARFVDRNMLGYKVSTVEDILSDPQLEAREFWQQVQAPWDADQTLRFPRSFGRFDGQRPVMKRLAPGPSEHTVEILGEWLRLDADDVARLRRAGAV
jgi:crotonobetainyl-CoA:carnitine CoA-transferase CaiB-like acyl-CoA transferase